MLITKMFNFFIQFPKGDRLAESVECQAKQTLVVVLRSNEVRTDFTFHPFKDQWNVTSLTLQRRRGYCLLIKLLPFGWSSAGIRNYHYHHHHQGGELWELLACLIKGSKAFPLALLVLSSTLSSIHLRPIESSASQLLDSMALNDLRPLLLFPLLSQVLSKLLESCMCSRDYDLQPMAPCCPFFSAI